MEVGSFLCKLWSIANARHQRPYWHILFHLHLVVEWSCLKCSSRKPVFRSHPALDGSRSRQTQTQCLALSIRGHPNIVFPRPGASAGECLTPVQLYSCLGLHPVQFLWSVPFEQVSAQMVRDVYSQEILLAQVILSVQVLLSHPKLMKHKTDSMGLWYAMWQLKMMHVLL